MKLKLFLLLLPLNSFAQLPDYDSVRFEMIRETVNFLATDREISGDIQFKVNCSKPNYSCLEVSISGKKLTGVLSKVRVWDQKKKGNTPEDIKKVKERIFSDIFGAQGKVYRKDLPGYSRYISKIEALLAKALVKSGNKASPRTLASTATVPAAVPKTTARHVDSSAGQKSAASRPETTRVETDISIQDTAETDLEIINQNTTKKENMQINLVYIALAAAAIAMVISFLALMKKPPRSKKSSSLPNDDRLAAQNGRIGQLEGIIREITTQLETIKSSVGSLDKRFYELTEKPTVVEFDVSGTRIAAQTAIQHGFASPEIRSFIWYAKFSDLDNGGFSPEMLVETQNGEQTYKIAVNGDRATYEVSDDLKAQRYALQNYEYLSGACQIRNQPQPGSKIYTVSPGVLNRSAGQDWLIERQAEIEFR